MVVCITDGSKLSSQSGVQEEVMKLYFWGQFQAKVVVLKWIIDQVAGLLVCCIAELLFNWCIDVINQLSDWHTDQFVN